MVDGPSLGAPLNFPSSSQSASLIPTQDDAFTVGTDDARWRSTFARVGVETSKAGLGAVPLTYGPNNVGHFSGSRQAVLGATAELLLTNPAAPIDSPAAVMASARADFAGGTARAEAAGGGSMVRGFARSLSANLARLAATALASFASGYVQGDGYDAAILASGVGSDAHGYVESYPGVGYGTATMQATGIGSSARGAVQYSGLMSSTSRGSQAHGFVTGGAFVSDTPGTMLATEIGAFACGAAEGGTIESDGPGSFAGGHARHAAASTPAFRPQIRATGDASFAFGLASRQNALLQAGNGASFVFGAAIGYDDTGIAEIVTSGGQVGNWAGGLVAAYAGMVGRITSSENGTFAFGCAYATIGNAYISATNEGSIAFGFAENGAILASGQASFAVGDASSANITASGRGSFAQGYAGAAGNIIASAANAVQFGPGTNAEPDSVRVGAAGLHFNGVTGPFAGGYANGQFWIVGGNVYVRSGGISKNLTLA